MQKFFIKLRKNYLILLNTFIPFLIFFIPVYTQTFVDEFEEITFFYNFYNLFDFSQELFFSLLMLFTILISFTNLIFFIVYMIDYYKLIIHKPLLNILLIINNVCLCLISLCFLIFGIVRSTYSNSDILISYNGFQLGSVLLVVYCIITTLFIIRNFKGKRNGKTF